MSWPTLGGNAPGTDSSSGALYLGPQTMAQLQAGAYADGTPALAALAKDTVVYLTDRGHAVTPSPDGTTWTTGASGDRYTPAELAALATPLRVGTWVADPTTGVVYGQSDGAGGYDPLGTAGTAGTADATNTAAQLAAKATAGTLVPYTTYVANDVGEEFYAAAANKLIPRYTRVRCDLPGFGGTWTGLTDDSAAIAAAAAYAATFTPRRSIELPRRVGVASSIVIPMYVHVYGHQYTGKGQIANTKVIPLAGASFSTGYVFNLNTDDGITAKENAIAGEPGTAWALNAWCSIKGVFFDNTPNSVVGSRLCVFAGPAVFEDIWGFFATQIIRQAPNVYADNTFIQRVFSHRSLDNSEYMIHLGSNTGGGGDCCYLSNMSCSPTNIAGGPEKFINLGYSNNGRISNVINGAINIIGSSEVAISNWHNENAKLTVERSSLSIHNSSVEVYAPRTDVPFEFNTSYGSTTDSFVVTLDNVRFSFGTDVTREGIIPAEVKVSKAYVLEVRNCCRQDATSGVITRTGIRINTDADVAIPTWNNFSGWLSQNGSLVRHTARGIYDVYASANTFYGVGTPSLVTRGGTGNTFVDGTTYYYSAQHLLDVPNMIGFNPTNAEISIAMPGSGANTKRVLVPVSHNAGVPVKGTVRVYRGTSPGSYDKYRDIPWFAAGYIQDMGDYVCGLPWIARSAGGLDTLKTLVGYSTVSTALGAVRSINFAQSPAYAAAFACDLGLGNRVQVGTLTGNITHSSPTNVPRSQTEVTYEFTQDGTGGRTITWSSLHKGAWPTASGTANQKMLVTGISNGTQIIVTGSSGWYS